MAAAPLPSQQITFGVVGGTGLTPDIPFRRTPLSWQGNSYEYVVRSGPRSLVIGPMMEIGVTRSWSVEVNALHRTLKYRIASTLPEQQTCLPTAFCGANISTWQFPILVKYRIPAARLKPFLAAGPSFRRYSNPAGTRPSPYGGTVGAGVEFQAGPLQLSPTIRYTRWGSSSVPFQPTITNQVELLSGIGFRTDAGSRRLHARKLWLGLVGGIPLTSDLTPNRVAPHTSEVKRIADFRFLAGLLVEAGLTGRLSLSASGLYRRLHFQDSPNVVVTWEIPVLAKYAFGNGTWRPFLEGGPSFRLAGNLNYTNPSRYGASAGVGAEALWRKTRFTPTLRYTRWAKDSHPTNFQRVRAKQDQVELLIGVSF